METEVFCNGERVDQSNHRYALVHWKANGEGSNLLSLFAPHLSQLPSTFTLRDDLNLNKNVTRQTRDLDAGTRRRMITEMRSIDGIQLCKISEVLQENRGFDHFVEGGAGRGQYHLEIPKYLFGLRFDVGADDLDPADGRVDLDAVHGTTLPAAADVGDRAPPTGG